MNNVLLNVYYIAEVGGDSYEFSDDTFANDEHKQDDSLDFEPTFHNCLKFNSNPYRTYFSGKNS